MNALPYIVTGLGVLFLLHGAWSLRSVRRARSRGVRTTARVVDIEKTSTSQGSVRTPVVRFRTADNREVQASPSGGTAVTTHRVGDDVSVFYDPSDPSTIYLGRGVGVTLLHLLELVLGLIAVVVGVALLVR